MALPLRLVRPFLGARIIKTGLAVFICLVLAHWAGSRYGSFMAVAAILAVQPSVARARVELAQQVTSNLIGGLIGALLGLWLGSSPVAMALAVVAVLGICTSLRLNETAANAVVAVLFIMDRPERDFLRYTGERIAAILAGMFVGYLVNRLLLKPNYSRRIKDELLSAADRVQRFGVNLVASLTSPERYPKAQIKEDAADIKRRLETAGYWLEMVRESRHKATSRWLLMEKSRTSMYVFVERISDIHKIVMELGGLRTGPELAAVSAALQAVLHYKSDVVSAALTDAEPDIAVGAAYAEALMALERLVAAEVENPGRRQRGLALHNLLINIRHMGWRMDSLVRLFRAPAT